MEQLVTTTQASLRSSDKGTVASLGPDVPLPQGLCRILIGLSVYLLICATVSSVQFGLSRYSLILEFYQKIENPLPKIGLLGLTKVVS